MLGELLDVSWAVEKMIADFHPVSTERVMIDDALDRVLAEDIIAPVDFPLFDNSSMDGFAVNTRDVRGATRVGPVRLEVVMDIPAGRAPSERLKKGQAARIMTGSMIPKGANAVVPLEETGVYSLGFEDYQKDYVDIYKAVNPGDYIRPQGQDIKQNELILTRHTRMRPQELGVVAMLGISILSVYRRPQIAVISTGNELLKIDEILERGKIYDANSYVISSLIQLCGCDPVNLGIARDDERDVQDMLDRAVTKNVDLIITSAGVSVGAFDFVRSVVEKFGKLEFWRVNMRPGKPLAFGSYLGIPFIGLPGNPVSAYVGFEVFIRPALSKLSGMKKTQRQVIRAHLSEPIVSDGRESYLRANIELKNGNYYARLAGHQGSGNLRSLIQGNALLIVPSEVKSLPIGALVDAWLLSDVNEKS